MQLRTIRSSETTEDPLVTLWQSYLRGQSFYFSEITGIFCRETEVATLDYQKEKGLVVDGIVGNRTWGHAMLNGLAILMDDYGDKNGPKWPPPPQDLKPYFSADRERVFGKFQYELNPRATNPEGIQISRKWVSENIVSVYIPQLKNIYGAPKSCNIQWHRAAKDPIVKLFELWEKHNLLHLISVWAGSWNPRFIRGSRTILSNHAFGSAFDINTKGNGLGQIPLLRGRPGSVRELVPLANSCGFFWGGHFSRPDGMHFEVVKV